MISLVEKPIHPHVRLVIRLAMLCCQKCAYSFPASLHMWENDAGKVLRRLIGHLPTTASTAQPRIPRDTHDEDALKLSRRFIPQLKHAMDCLVSCLKKNFLNYASYINVLF